MAKSSTERSRDRDDRQRAMGRTVARVWASVEEHEKLKALLLKLRGESDSLDWYECDMSGHLRAIGDKGEYWIMEWYQPYYNLDLVNPSPSGPHIESIGFKFTSIEEAKKAAEGFEENVFYDAQMNQFFTHLNP